MTVKQLREILSKFRDDTEVGVSNFEVDGLAHRIDTVRVLTDEEDLSILGFDLITLDISGEDFYGDDEFEAKHFVIQNP